VYSAWRWLTKPTRHWWYIINKAVPTLFFISFIYSTFKHYGDALLKYSTFWSFSFKEVYPLSACTASLIRHSSVDLNLSLIFLSCILHNLWIFTEPHPPPYWGTYYLITDELGWRQQNFVWQSTCKPITALKACVTPLDYSKGIG